MDMFSECLQLGVSTLPIEGKHIIGVGISSKKKHREQCVRLALSMLVEGDIGSPGFLLHTAVTSAR